MNINTFLKRLFSTEICGNHTVYKFLGFKFKFKHEFKPPELPLIKIKRSGFENNLAIAAIVKNETFYIKEWIEYHRLIGFEKFYIYDNDSEDNLRECLSKYIKNGIVEYKLFPGIGQQVNAYQNAIDEYKNLSRYIAFIDIDEFITLPQKESFLDILESFELKYKNFGGLGLNWAVYGSSHYKERKEWGGGEKGLVLESFLYRAEDEFNVNKHIKTICNPRKVFRYSHCHFPVFYSNYTNLGIDGKKIKGAFSNKINLERARINHYFSKSLEDYMLKRSRRCATDGRIRDMRDFYSHDRNEVFDDTMAEYAMLIKKRLEDN